MLIKWKFPFVIISALLFCCCALPSEVAFAQAVSDEDLPSPDIQIAGELELEKIVAERIEHMLQPVVGPVVVIVDIKLTSLPVSLEGFTYSEQESLPGLPVSISENVRKIGGGSGWDYNEIVGIQIHVLVGEAMSQESREQITALIPRWINLNYGRGDQIIVEPVPFVRAPLTMVDFLFSFKGIALLAVFLTVFAIILGILLRGGGNSTVHTKMSNTAPSGISGPLSGTGVAQMVEELSQIREKKTKTIDETQITTSNILSMPDAPVPIRILRNTDTGQKVLGPLAKLAVFKTEDLNQIFRNGDPTLIAMGLNIAKPGTAAEFLQQLAPNDRMNILRKWQTLDQLPEETVQERTLQLKDLVNSLKANALTTTGEEPFIKLISQSPESVGKTLFADISVIDSSVAETIRKQVFFMEDLIDFNDELIRKAVLSVPRETLAILVNDCSEQVREKIFSNISTRAGNLVREEAALSKHVAPEKAAEAKRTLFEQLQKYENA